MWWENPRQHTHLHFSHFFSVLCFYFYTYVPPILTSFFILIPLSSNTLSLIHISHLSASSPSTLSLRRAVVVLATAGGSEQG